jgi:hypothetical protein
MCREFLSAGFVYIVIEESKPTSDMQIVEYVSGD